MINLFLQGLLRFFTPDQIERIQSVKIGIGGLGGLGSNVAMNLVRCGFRHFELLDHDKIEPSNLNRQYYFNDQIGCCKTKMLRKTLLSINPELEISYHDVAWSEENADQFFKNCDFVVEGFDNAEIKRQFVEFYQSQIKHVISGNGMAGLWHKQPLQIQKIGNVYLVGDQSTDTAQGHPPLSPRVTACAGMMAGIILDLTLDIPLNV